MRLFALLALAACSTSSGGSTSVDGGPGGEAAATDGAGGETHDDASADGSGAADAHADGPVCACTAGGACDAFGCPPDYNDTSAFAAWCAAVQGQVPGHAVSMRTCGALLVMTYTTDAGCETGYVADQTSGDAVATLNACGAAAPSCGSLVASSCVPPCCLDGSCTLGISSLCPPWQPPADAGGD